MAAPGASDNIIVITGGDAVDPAHLDDLPSPALVIAADSGIDHALAVGLHVDVAVGDFDSVAPAALQAAVDQGAVVERHPTSKDATDFELALDAALRHGARRIRVVGGHGGRLDHHLANALLLASPRYASVELVAHMGDALVTVIRDAAVLSGEPGDLVTLLAVGGPAVGVTTEGLRYELDDEDLAHGSSRGVSNELVAHRSTVRLRDGVVLAVQPARPTDNRKTTR